MKGKNKIIGAFDIGASGGLSIKHSVLSVA